MMLNRMAAIVAIVVLLSSSILACAGPSPEPTPTLPPPTATPIPTPTLVPPTPTPEVREPNYSNAILGLSIWFPETWISEEMPDMVAFATSSELISGDDWETGAAFAIIGAQMESGETLEDLIQQLLDQSSLDDIKTTELQPVSIGDESGVITDYEATPMGATARVKGFMAGAEHNRFGYVFMGVSIEEDWPEYGSVLEAMLRSVRFTDPSGTFTSQDLGLKMWYPEDWIIEEGRDQVIFATSRSLIDTGNLESGAAFLVRGSSRGGAGLVDWFEEELQALAFDEGGPSSDMAPRTIASQDGLIIDLDGLPSGADTPIVGFAAAVAYDGWGYLFLGVTAVDEWQEYGPTLEEMLDSVQFTE